MPINLNKYFGGIVPSSPSITLPAEGMLFKISGNTNILSVSIKPAGQFIGLIFGGHLTVFNGGNLQLTGNFVVSPECSLTLLSDGINWKETYRYVPSNSPTTDNPDAMVSTLFPGFMDVVNYATESPVNVSKTASDPGSSVHFARANHKHDIDTAAALPLTPQSTNTEGSTTTLARSGHTHHIGLPVQQATATADDPTTSTSDTPMSGMSITLAAAGDYLIFFHGSVENSNANVPIHVSVYVNGSKQLYTEVHSSSQANAPTPVAISTLAAGLSAGQIIDIRWRVNGNTGTAHQRALTIVNYN